MSQVQFPLHMEKPPFKLHSILWRTGKSVTAFIFCQKEISKIRFQEKTGDLGRKRENEPLQSCELTFFDLDFQREVVIIKVKESQRQEIAA